MVNQLVKFGADVNARDKQGETPLSLSISNPELSAIWGQSSKCCNRVSLFTSCK